jgi:hypothetical protein
MGFIPGALVQAIPEIGGVNFTLCDENIKRYSELDAFTKEKGGKLIQSHCAVIKGKHTPVLFISGQVIYNAGLSFKVPVIARYEYGLIQVRKLPDTIKIIYMTTVTDKRTGKTMPKIRLTGEWLPGFGFAPDTLLTAAIDSGSITFKLHDENIGKYGELVRYSRKNKLKLLQVRQSPSRGKMFPYIMITGSFLDKSGFLIGDTLVANCEHGFIKLLKLEDEKTFL